MGSRRNVRRRHRILLWLDEAGNPQQVALALYVDDEMLTERTWTPEPFDGPHDVLSEALAGLDIQGRLW